MSENKKYTIAYQGAPGAFSHLASQRFTASFLKDHSVTFAPKSSFEDVFEHASSVENGLACVPFENSTVGSIIQNYQLLWISDLKIFSELTLPIHHQLLALPGTRMEDVIDVYSHPVALDQCKRIFHEHSWMKAQIYFDTGAAARLIKEEKRKNAAAIASLQAADEYGLEVIAPDIEDFHQNQTRFVLIGLDSSLAENNPKVPYKVSIAIEPGEDLNAIEAYAPLLSKSFKLAKIESIPVPERPFQFRLFLDFVVHSEEARSQAKKSLQAFSGTKAYGSYCSLVQ